MVVIEPEENEEVPNSKPSSSKVRTDGAEASANVNGDASDGFETASERDISDGEEGDSLPPQQQQPEDRPKAGGDSYEDALNDEQLKQVCLPQPLHILWNLHS